MESPSGEKEKMIKEPLLVTTSSSSKGGFRTVPFIIANEAFERVASIGLTPNMILYLTRVYGMENVGAAKVLFLWSAASNLAPVVGAFLADSYVGRYPMIGFGSIVSLLGMVLLWLTTLFPQASPPCYQLGNCEPPTTVQLLLLYSSFVLMSIGAGGIRASSMAFGADQLNRSDNLDNEATFRSFLGWYYSLLLLSSFVALTCVVYIQDIMGWKVGFGVPALLMFMSALSFFFASPFYVKLKAKTGLLAGLAQVLVASYRKRNLKLSSEATDETYYHGSNGSLHPTPSGKLRFLNKACIVRNPQRDLTLDGRASDPWSLCTVDQVEELKALIRVFPIWSTGIIMNFPQSQSSFTVLLILSMDRHITSNIEIPAGSFSMFLIISLISWVALYDLVLLPLASKVKGKPVRLSLKQRMGIGLLCSSASMVSAAIVERNRRRIAVEEGLSGDPQTVVHLSAMWLIPHFVFIGLADAFTAIGQNEFFYSELPKTMRSIASNLFGLAIFASNLTLNLITSTIDDVTKRPGEHSWISSNINLGHYDYYFWLLAVLSLLNFIYFLACSKAYGPCQGEGNEGRISSGQDDWRDGLISRKTNIP